MTNTQIAVKQFYLNSHYNSVSAKIMFPFFYRKFLKWLGEIPAEIEEEKKHSWISRGCISENLDNFYLLIPLQKRALILEWGAGDGDPDNCIFIGPLDLIKDSSINFVWWREHHNQVKEYDHPSQWEREVWNA